MTLSIVVLVQWLLSAPHHTWPQVLPASWGHAFCILDSSFQKWEVSSSMQITLFA